MATFSAFDGGYPKVRGGYVACLRTSDRPYSRLDVDVQRKAIAALLAKGRAKLIAELIEAEPLEDGQRPKLNQAIDLCKNLDATLVVGKLDRMRGGVGWLDMIFAKGVKFRGADIPYLHSSTFYRLKSDDWSWRCTMSSKVKEALVAADQRGVLLGGKRENADGLRKGPAASAVVRQRNAISRDWRTFELIKFHQERGVNSLTFLATRLNQMGHEAPKGGKWNAAQVRRVIKICDG